MDEVLTISEASKRIGCSKSLLQQRCKSGDLKAFKVGKTYRIRATDLDAWTEFAPVAVKKQGEEVLQEHEDLLKQIDSWIEYLTHVRGLAATTISTHRWHLRDYLKKVCTKRQGLIHVGLLFDPTTLQTVYSVFPPHAYASKLNTYNALLSFGKSLVRDGKLPSVNLDALKAYKPRRMQEPKRTHLRREDIAPVFDLILSRKRPGNDNLALSAMVACMLFGGLRVSEVCNLAPRDIDLHGQRLTIRHGKGGKSRSVGISQSLHTYLAPYHQQRATGQHYFLLASGDHYTKRLLQRHVLAISRRLGLDISCHGLRRSFATLAASQGRSINFLRIALGHANIATTQAYLRTSEAEVVESMKGW